MKRTGFLFAALLSCAVRLDAAPKWSRLDTPNFIIIATGRESDLRELGKQFEGFREALTRLLSGAVTSTPVPTVVLVFPDDKTFEPFKPVYNGKPVDVGGLFMPRSAVNYILLGPNHGMERLRPIFHEYTHLMVSNVAPVLPVWLNEGIAEYYSTFEMDKAGRTVLFGKPISEHFQELSQGRWMPLDALLAVAHDSPEYNEGSRRGVFYAESWMLVHMILNGQADRRQSFAAYLQELGAGTAPKDAWQHTFGRDDVYRALREYATRQTVTMRQYKPSDQIVFASGVGVPVPPADVECTLGEVLAAQQNTAAAVQRFDRALAAAPGSARATVGKAAAELFRELKAGEQRTEGQLERIDCAGKGIEFLVRTGDGVIRFHADAFDRVEFITYRTDLEGKVNCGARTPADRVYVSWTPGSPDGTAVAVEFLPKE